MDYKKVMLGTFSPQKEAYVIELQEETTPSGFFARGNYTAKTKVLILEIYVDISYQNFGHPYKLVLANTGWYGSVIRGTVVQLFQGNAFMQMSNYILDSGNGTNKRKLSEIKQMK